MNILKLQPAAVGSAVAALYAVVVMILNVFVYHTAVFDAQVIVALVSALGALGVRQLVTPVARPRDSAGNDLVPKAPLNLGPSRTA